MLTIEEAQGKVNDWINNSIKGNHPPSKIELLTASQKRNFCKYLAELSAIIYDDSEIERYFDAWCAIQGTYLLAKTKEVSSIWPIDCDNHEQVKKLLMLRHIFNCESYNEMVSRYLCLIEEHRLPETTEYVEKLQQRQIADF